MSDYIHNRSDAPGNRLVEMAKDVCISDSRHDEPAIYIRTFGGQNFAEWRLDQLDRIGRRRALTDAEQREVLLRAKQARAHARRREKYASDPTYRAAVRDAVNRSRRVSHASA